MKILHCLRNYFPDKVGGTEIYVEALCKELELRSIESKIVKPSFNEAPKAYRYNGINIVEYLETSFPSPELQAGLRAPDGIIHFKKLLLSEKPDAVHFHETAGSNGITIFHVMAAKEMGFPVFTSFHLAGNICMRNSFLYKGKHDCDGIINEFKCSVCMLQKKGLPFLLPEIVSYLGKSFKQRISMKGPGKILNYPLHIRNHIQRLITVNSCSEKMFVLSTWYKSLLVVNGMDENKIIVLPAAIPTAHATATLRKNNTGINSKIRFVYAGRVSQVKGLHILLAAILQIKQSNWELDIYGAVYDEEYYNSCLELTEKHPYIHWKGVMVHDKMIETIAGYDALVFPSIIQETMGLTMLEAFAAGVPVIGSAIWSVTEKVQDSVNGLLFKTGNIASLRKVLERVLDHPNDLKKMAASIKAPVDMAEVASITAHAYKEVLEITHHEI